MLSIRDCHFCLPALLLSALVVGCNSTESPEEKTEASASSGMTEAEKCRNKLAAGIRRLNPATFGLQSNPERSVNGLNAWLAGCGSSELQELSLDERAVELTDGNVRATALRFTPTDGTYIRDCLLLRDLTTTISEATMSEVAPAEQDSAVVNSVFDWIVRNISLLPAETERPPLGLTDTMMTGRGSVEDRIWIFAEALRQLQMDAFLIRPNADPAESGDQLATAAFLIGVALEGQTFLFDPTAGLPVTGEDTGDLLDLNVLPISTLKDHDRWKESRVGVVAQVSTFAPRMFYLQQELSVEDSAVLFEELTGGVSEIHPLLQRISEASEGLWSADDISVWSYPEERAIAAQSLSEEDQQAFAALMRPFQAPFERDTFATESTEEMTTVPEELSAEERRGLIEQRLADDFARRVQSSEELFGKPSRRLLKTRIQQLLGNKDAGVIQQLQQIRIMSMESTVRIQVPSALRQMNPGMPELLEIPFPQMIREVNESSTGSALYWTALRQIEDGNFGAAITTLKNYRRQYKDSQWKFPSMINQSIAFVALDREDEAKELLTEADVDENPEKLRVQRLLQLLGTDG